MASQPAARFSMTALRFSVVGGMLAALAIGSVRDATAPLHAQSGSQAVTAAGERVGTMDFVAITADGRPVSDLKAEEISLRIDGRVRPLRSVRLVVVPGVADTPTPQALRAAFVPRPFGTNDGPDLGRAIVIIVDDESVPIGRERALHSALGDFLSHLSPRDRVALVTVPHGGIKADLTTEHDRVAAAIRQVAGAGADRQQIAGVTTADDQACRTRDTLRALAGTLDSLRGGGQPVTVVFLSTSLVGPSPMQLAQRGAGAPVMGVCLLQQEDFEKVGIAAAGARAQMYVIHPDFSAEVARTGIEHLRGVTGAPLFHLTTTDEPGLARVARETSAYYAVTFDIQSGERMDKTHEVSVRVSRPGVTVRHRPDIVLERTDTGTSAVDRLSPRDMSRTTRFYGDLGLRVAGFTSRNTGADGLKVVGVFEATEPTATIAEAAASLFAENGRLVAEWSAASGDLSGRAVAFAMTAPAAGRYRLRVAAVDSAGRRGAADFDAAVELTRVGPLSLSSLALGSMRETGFMPKLQFTTESVAVGYLELYGGAPGSKLSVVFEIAQTPDGDALLQVPVFASATSQSDRVVITGSLAIGALPPGDYVARAVIEIEGQPAGRVMRALRKTSQK